MPPAQPNPSSDPLHLTWAMLLARWTEFAQSALALPKNRQGARWKAAVPDIIALQAITHALGEVDSLTGPGERALALDRAEMQFRGHASTLHALWEDEPLHPQLVELIADTKLAHAGALAAGLEWCVADEVMVAEHPAGLVDALISAGFAGDLFVPTPGVSLFEACPAVFLHVPGGGFADDRIVRQIEDYFPGLGEPERRPGIRQVYRQFDFGKGKAVRDLVLPMLAGPAGGQPLLVGAIQGGRSMAVTLPPRKGPEQEPLPLEFGEG